MKVTVLTHGTDTEVLGVLHNAQVTPKRIADILLSKGLVNRDEHNGIEWEVNKYEDKTSSISYDLPNGGLIVVRLHETEIA